MWHTRQSDLSGGPEGPSATIKKSSSDQQDPSQGNHRQATAYRSVERRDGIECSDIRDLNAGHCQQHRAGGQQEEFVDQSSLTHPKGSGDPSSDKTRDQDNDGADCFSCGGPTATTQTPTSTLAPQNSATPRTETATVKCMPTLKTPQRRG